MENLSGDSDVCIMRSFSRQIKSRSLSKCMTLITNASLVSHHTLCGSKHHVPEKWVFLGLDLYVMVQK